MMNVKILGSTTYLSKEGCPKLHRIPVLVSQAIIVTGLSSPFSPLSSTIRPADGDKHPFHTDRLMVG